MQKLSNISVFSIYLYVNLDSLVIGWRIQNSLFFLKTLIPGYDAGMYANWFHSEHCELKSGRMESEGLI